MPRILIEVEVDESMVAHTTRESRRLVLATRRADGFTLVEMMMAVTIIGILVTIALMGFAAPLSRVRRVACYSNQRVLEGAVVPYRIDNEGADPTDIEDLLPYVRYVKSAKCPADDSAELTLDTDNFSVTCPLHPR